MYGMPATAGRGVGGLAGFLGGPWGMGLGLGASLLGGLFAQDPRKQQAQYYKQMQGQLGRLFDPNQMGLGAQGRYNAMWRGAQPALMSLMGGQSAVNQRINSGLAARGLGTSGLGAAMRGAGAGWYGAQKAGLQGSLWNNAWDQENQARMAQAQMLMNGSMMGAGMPNMGNNVLGAWMGTGGQLFDYATRARLGIK